MAPKRNLETHVLRSGAAFADTEATTTPSSRGRHSKSQSVSSDVNNTAPNGTTNSMSPPLKAATPKRTRRKSTLSRPTSPIVLVAPKSARKSQIPTMLQFPLVMILSFGLNSLLFSLIAEVTTGDLAAISKHTESWVEIAGLLTWKAVELAIYWFGKFDAYDVASLSLLLTTPYTILLSLFFVIRPSTLALTTLATVISTTVPFTLLRPLSPTHHPNTAPRGSLRNRSIITDPWTTVSTSLLATAIFAVLLEFSFATFLPTWLITHFDRIRDLSAAHLGAKGLPALLISLVPAGYAAMQFLFISSTGAPPTPVYVFESANSSFMEHVYHNSWGWWSNRQKELIGRTVLATAMMMAETTIQVWGTLDRTELVGAVGYAGIWCAGLVLVGGVFDWVGGPSG